MDGSCYYQLGDMDCHTAKVIFFVLGSFLGFAAIVAWFFVGLHLLCLFDRCLASPTSSPTLVETGEFAGIELSMLVDHAGGQDEDGVEGTGLGGLLHPLGVSVPIPETVQIPVLYEGVVVARVDPFYSPTTSGAA